MNVYFVRHGITKANIEHVFQLDSEPLFSLGTEQVKKMSKLFKDFKISKIYSSPLQRAVDTANILNEEYDVTVLTDYRIKEIESSSIIKGDSVYLEKHTEIVQAIDQKLFSRSVDRISDEETFFDIQKRVSNFLETLENENLSDNIIVVSHHRTIAFILAHMMGYKEAKQLHSYFEHFFNINNASVVHVGYQKDLVNRYSSEICPWRLVSIHSIDPLIS